mmetsp:Transcript_6900/g.7049  ORF Transcript_6900/g.7049 Transcript_6900/m.7049 type:complete len:85 (+) Transcript_6900:594-848(+)
MIKYGVDMVICNLLHTRHDVASALTSTTSNNNPPQEKQGNDTNLKKLENEQQLTIRMIWTIGSYLLSLHRILNTLLKMDVYLAF